MLGTMKGMWPCSRGRLGWAGGVEGASLEMPSVLNPECREELSPWGECIQVEATVSAKAGVSLGV